MPVIDTHTHVIPRFFLERVFAQGWFGVRMEGDEVLHPDGDRYPVGPQFYDPIARMAEMDRLGIDIGVLSASPTLFFYGESQAELIPFARDLNDDLAEWVDTYPDRFAALASLPLQAPRDAAAELERAVTGLKFVGGGDRHEPLRLNGNRRSRA
jgi:aminocarboxymuconate-semialdehyde decarboxylase